MALVGVVAVLTFLTVNRIQYRRWILASRRIKEASHRFGTDLNTEMLRSRVHQTLDDLTRSAQRELDLIFEATGADLPQARKFSWSSEPRGCGSDGLAASGEAYPEKHHPNYNDAFMMAAKGADPKSLATATGLSEGEAELIFNLQRYQMET
jgi:hypothetical protein